MRQQQHQQQQQMRGQQRAMALHPHPQLLLLFMAVAMAGLLSAEGASPAELAALRAVQAALTDPHGKMDTWVGNDPCANWAGVVCGATNGTNANTTATPVVSLDLSQGGLTGTISPAIGTLSRLQTLNLSFNMLTGPLPLSMASLTSLQVLDLSINRDVDDKSSTGLTGSIAPVAGILSLQYLLLNTNGFNGTLPASLGNLRELQWLYLDSNQITGTLPSQLGSLPALTDLSVSDNQMLGTIPRQLGTGVAPLYWLGLALNDFSGAIPQELGNQTGLFFLDLKGNRFTGQLPSELGQLSELEYLYVQDNQLTGPLPPQLGGCSKLVEFMAFGNRFTGSIPSQLSNLTQLKILWLSGNNLTGTIPPAVVNISSLTTVNLDSNKLTGRVPPTVGSLPNLQYLTLFDNQLTGGLPAPFRSQVLSILDVHGNPGLGGSIPAGLCKGNSLTVLALSNTGVGGAIPPDLAACRSLQRFRVGTGSLVGSVPGFCGSTPQPHLNYVELSSNDLAGEVPASFGSCPGLQTLKLDGNHLTGSIPIELGTASNLTVLDLSRNQLSGSIPSQLGALSSLSSLALSGNVLSGAVPRDLFQLSFLQTLRLSDNQLTGPLPPSVSGLQRIQDLELGGNRFAGSIPSELGSLTSLIYGLNLSHNGFNGSIPGTLGGLSRLQSLDLSYNNLSGQIPGSFAGLAALTFFNVSYNQLSGPIPDAPNLKNFPQSSFLGNTGFCGSLLSDCSGGQVSSRSSKNKLSTGALAGIIVAVALICVGVLLAVWISCFDSHPVSDDGRVTKRKSWSAPLLGGLFGKGRSSRPGPAASALLPDLYQKFTFQEIMDATNNLNDRNLIGQGGFGKVYKGLLKSGQEIAVKKMTVEEEDPDVFQSHMREIQTAGQVRHRNIVRLIGYCKHNDTALILYDYHPFGSLGDFLYKKKENSPDLSWELRYKIALGTAQAISYLHSDCVPQVLHRDIKSNNILLDEEFVPYVTDFGVAKLVARVDGERTAPMSVIAGSVGYIAPEYTYTLNVGEKSDVYSYGVVLLELLTGKMPVDPSFEEGRDLVHWVRNKLESSDTIDVVLEPGLRKAMQGSEAQEISATLRVAIMCTSETPSDRPTMKEVEDMLLRVKSFSNPDLLARNRSRLESLI